MSLGLVLCPAESVAQSDYPNKPVKLIIGFAPGGSTDIVGRIVAQRLGERLGQNVVVENKAGAGGTIGADATAKAAPDGYTLTLGTTSTHAIAAGAYSNLPYDPVANFTQISLVAITPYLLVVNAQVKANNLAEFVALARSQPGKLNYASAGAGTATHLAMEMLKDAAKIDIVHIPYKGNAPADLAIIAGDVAGSVRIDAGAAAEREGEQGPPVGGRNRDALARAARRSHRGRARLSGLRGRAVAGDHGPRQHAQARRRSPAQGDRRHRRDARVQSRDGRQRRRAPQQQVARRIPRDAARPGRRST